MNENSNTILIVDSSLDFSQIQPYLNDKSINIVASDYQTHKKFNELNLKFIDLDDFLSSDERHELYELTNELINWPKKLENRNEFKINDINILDFFGPLEFHEFLLRKLIKFFSIKNIIDSLNPNKLIISNDLLSFTKNIFPKTHTEILTNTNETEYKGIINDQIEIRFNIFSKPLTFYLSKKWYSRFKSIFDEIISSLYDLKLKNHEKEIILLLEFNTTLYRELISNIANSNKTLVLLNLRRSALLDKESRNFLKGINAKILNPTDFFDLESKKEFILKKKLLTESFENIWNDTQLLNIFSKNNVSFWHVIENSLKNIYKNRLDDYLKLYFISNNIINSLNIKSILCLNESGETENIFLQHSDARNKTFLLQHSFLRYEEKSYAEQWKFEDQYIHGLKSQNLLLWGNADYDFFSKFSNIDPKKLIICGSPRHDIVKSNLKSPSQKKIKVLITLTPISVRSGNQTVSLIEKYDSFLKRIINFLKTNSNVEIIIKLHPGENLHNNILLNSLEKIDNVKVFQTKNPYELIEKSNFLITITPELYDSSTIMLDALSLETPVVQFILNSSNSSFNTIDEPISTFFENENIEEILLKYMSNDYCQSLIKKIPQKLEKLLSNRGNSCQNITKIISQ